MDAFDMDEEEDDEEEWENVGTCAFKIKNTDYSDGFKEKSTDVQDCENQG